MSSGWKGRGWAGGAACAAPRACSRLSFGPGGGAQVAGEYPRHVSLVLQPACVGGCSPHAVGMSTRVVLHARVRLRDLLGCC